MIVDKELLSQPYFKDIQGDNPALVARKLGPLSNWWMSNDAFQNAESNRLFDSESVFSCDLKSQPGSCWPILAMKNSCHALRDAMLLPCIWKQTTKAQGVPPKLENLASQVINAIAGSNICIKGAEPGDFNLHLDRRFQGIEIQDDVFETLGSAWVALAGGLISAMSGLRVSTSVWVSSAMDVRDGSMKVGLLKKKMLLAASGSHGKCEKFFVSTANHAEALNVINDNPEFDGSMEVCPLEQFQGNDLATVLQPYLSECFNEPVAPTKPERGETKCGEFRACVDYFLYALEPYSFRSIQFYRSKIMPTLAVSLQKQMEDSLKFKGCTHYVGVLSRSPELVVLGSAAVRAKKILILHDGTLPSGLQYVIDTFSKQDVQTKITSIPEKHPVKSVVDAVYAFVSDAPDPTKVVIDVKPATKKLTYALLRAAKPQHRILCIQEKEGNESEREDRRPVPGEEILEFLDRAP
jgi:hypothetical protein